MSAYNFINEYFPGWQVVGFATTGYGGGKLLIQDGNVILCIHVNMNGAANWTDSDVTPSYVEVNG